MKLRVVSFLVILLVSAFAAGAADQSDLPRFLSSLRECLATPGCVPGPVAGLEKRAATATGGVTIEVIRAAADISVSNGASLLPAVSPHSWITIRGMDLASETRLWTADDFNGDLLPINLSGTSVRIGDKDAAVWYISPTQINALVPPDMPVGPAMVTVTSPVGPAASAAIDVIPYAPGIFPFDPQNRRYVAAVHPDGTYIGPRGLFGDAAVTRPLKAGGAASLYVNGLGSTNPAVPPGRLFSDARPMNGVEFLHITIGGKEATVGFAGAVAPGEYQVNVTAPNLPSGDYPVLVDFGGVVSQDGVFIAIEGDPSASTLQVTPSSLTMQAFTTADPTSALLQLDSNGENFDFTVESSAPWLTAAIEGPQPTSVPSFRAAAGLSGRTPATLRVTADGRNLAPGNYNEQLTIQAPGTKTPSTVVSVSVSVSNAPQITVSRTAMSFWLVTGSNTLSIPVSVLAGGQNVDYTAVASNGGDWLTVTPPLGTTPGTVSVNLNSKSHAPGTLNGSVRVTPVGGGAARDISVELNVVATAASNGAPQINATNEDEIVWGYDRTFTIQGQNLTGATAVTFNPSAGMTIDGQLSVTATRVSFSLVVDPSAALGPHTVSVTSPRGTSNALGFTVRRGVPQIRSMSPMVVTPGRFYATSSITVNMGSDEFIIPGADLTGVNAIAVDPPDGITALPASGFPEDVSGVVSLSPAAQPGMRKISILTPADRSNELMLEVRAAPSTAPVISNVVLNPCTVSTSSGTIRYSGHFAFTDADGDISSGALIRMMMDVGTGSEYITLVQDGGSYLSLPGQTSGTVNFSFTKSFFLASGGTGNLKVLFTLKDAAGNLSNFQTATVSAFYFPVI